MSMGLPERSDEASDDSSNHSNNRDSLGDSSTSVVTIFSTTAGILDANELGWSQVSDFKNGLRTNLSVTDHDHLADGGNTVHDDEDESRARSKNSRVGRKLADMENGSVVLVESGVGIVELNEALTHVEVVSRETRPNDGNLGGLDVLNITEEIFRVESDVKGRTTVREARKQAFGLRPALLVPGGVPQLCSVLGWVENILGRSNIVRLGFDPETMTEPSGRRTADEWYILGIRLADKPSLDHLLPAGASGSKITGVYNGPSA